MVKSTAISRQPTGQFSSPVSRTGQLSGEQTADQHPGDRSLLPNGPFGLQFGFGVGADSGWAQGGSFVNPMAFPGWGGPLGYFGSYLNYRWMLQHPILQLVKSIDNGIIGASSWEYVATYEGVPQEWIDLVKQVFDPLRDSLITDFMVEGRDYGWAGGEPLWDKDRKGRYIINGVKPLVVDVTNILKDPKGHFAGLRNYVRGEGQTESQIDLAAPFKAWIYTYCGRNGYLYGRSWLENVRATAWLDWLDCAQQLQRLGRKITGQVTVITSPAGNFPGVAEDGKTSKMVSYKKNAVEAISALANGAAGVWFPSIGLAVDSKGGIDAMKVIGQLAGKSLTNVDVKDFGSQAPSIMGLLERMRHAEELMFAGGLRSSRTGMEGKHGTKEEAGQHTDTGTLNAEIDDRDFARQVSSGHLRRGGLVNALLVANYGPAAMNAVRIKTPSLVDRQAAVAKAVLLALLNNQIVAQEYSQSVDMDKLTTVLGMFIKKEFDAAAVKEAADAQTANQKDVKNPDPQGGRPSES